MNPQLQQVTDIAYGWWEPRWRELNIVEVAVADEAGIADVAGVA